MITTLQALALVTFAGLFGTLTASLFLLLPLKLREQSLTVMVGFAVGALSGAAFFELLPHAVASLNGEDFERIGQLFLAAVFASFLLDKLLRWREASRESLGKPVAALMLSSDALHKFVDGLVVVAAFLTDPYLGLATVLAVVAHEIPHELSVFAILLGSGYRRLRAFCLKLLSTAAIVPGGLVAVLWLGPAENLRPYVLTVAAGMFIYVALAALVPQLQRHTRPATILSQGIPILIGAGVIFTVHQLAH